MSKYVGKKSIDHNDGYDQTPLDQGLVAKQLVSLVIYGIKSSLPGIDLSEI